MDKPVSSPHCQVTKNHNKKEKKRKKEKKHKHRNDPNKKKERMIVRECNGISATITKTDTTDTQELFGPALPPYLQASSRCVHQNQIIGPVLPVDIKPNATTVEASECDEDDVIGPLPMNNVLHSMTSAQIALEQRALEIKLSKLDAEKNPVDTATREEWMLELPDVGVKSGLSSLKRTFRTKEGPDFSDRSSWTKTPNSSEQLSTSKVIEATKSPVMEQYQIARDADQEKIAKKLMKVHKNEDSLYEMHQKKLKKEKKEKQLCGKIERRPFSRDVDLQLNKIDKNQTKSIVAKAKLLGSRFSTGNVKYL